MAGSDRGVQDLPATTGWVFYNPLASSVFEYPTFVRSAVWTHNLDEGRAVNEEITFTTKDQMQVAADISLAYHLDATKVPAFYVKFRSDDLDGFTHGFLRNLARQMFDETAGSYEIGQIMGDNAAFLKETRKRLQDELKPIGVEIDQFGFIGAPRPPAAVIGSINAKAQATQLAIQKENEVRQVEADLRKEVIKADTYARNVLVKAEAEADANRKVAASLTPTLVEYTKANRWDGKLPQVTSGSVLMNLSKE